MIIQVDSQPVTDQIMYDIEIYTLIIKLRQYLGTQKQTCYIHFKIKYGVANQCRTLDMRNTLSTTMPIFFIVRK